jgi:hypothetical protein
MAIDMDKEVSTTEAALAERGLSHVTVTKRGKALTLLIDHDDADVRMTHVAGRTWRLDVHHHTGKWEQTPFTGDIDELIDAALSLGRLDDY